MIFPAIFSKPVSKFNPSTRFMKTHESNRTLLEEKTIADLKLT